MIQDKEKQRIKSQEALLQHKAREEQFNKLKEDKSKKKVIVLSIIVVLAVLLIAGIVYSVTKPGKYDKFAQCLTEKGAVMQGENWCQYTNAQKAMFGNSFKYINYEVNPNLAVRPTWIIDGEHYEKVQSFEHLSALTGCKY